MTLPPGQIKLSANNLGLYPKTFKDKHGYDFEAYQLSEDELIKFANKLYSRGFNDCWQEFNDNL